ncbi:MAG: hypothetical protein LBB48_09885 [Treponema sp.]|jgi:hypothetical protein|nr:hypothetical protein [Treponema sp.]
MEDQVLFTPSAFKHGETEASIYHAIETKIYEGRIKNYDNKFGIAAFNARGNLIETLYNIVDDECVQILHAMKARKGVITQLERLDGGEHGIYDR